MFPILSEDDAPRLFAASASPCNGLLSSDVLRHNSRAGNCLRGALCAWCPEAGFRSDLTDGVHGSMGSIDRQIVADALGRLDAGLPIDFVMVLHGPNCEVSTPVWSSDEELPQIYGDDSGDDEQEEETSNHPDDTSSD